MKSNNSINFLDITLKKESYLKISTKWFNKHTLSDRYINFHFAQPISYKKNVVTALADTAVNLTSAEYRPEILKKIKQFLHEHNYPEEFVNKIIKKKEYTKSTITQNIIIIKKK